jgi:hypothetical protein
MVHSVQTEGRPVFRPRDSPERRGLGPCYRRDPPSSSSSPPDREERRDESEFDRDRLFEVFALERERVRVDSDRVRL